ncbi:DUF7694 domain-containing protein [Litorisediminicola beolgyonensis]|uniref:DUF7694 domain-containing protein n=1 Tax=Litorisediminicola beolgyonensis TaxID=1173614 RepID=A0ABW3ZIN5_9RHOB
MTYLVRDIEVLGHKVTVDDVIGHAAVYHDGSIGWDTLFEIKNLIWGREARAIEVYPAATDLVNSCACRHLWRLGPLDFCPNLLGPVDRDDSLHARYVRAWRETEG